MSKLPISPEKIQERWVRHKAMFETIGQGITHWSAMEALMVRVATRLLGTTGPKAGIVFYSIANFHSWIAIIDDLFELDGTYPKSQKAWRKLIERLKAENDIRVRLAHQEANDDFGEDTEVRLRRSEFDLRSKTKKQMPLTDEELVGFIARVSRLDDQLLELLGLMTQPRPSR